MMLGQPESRVSPVLGVPSQFQTVPKCIGNAAAFFDRGEIKD
jgi:hypothetical protein